MHGIGILFAICLVAAIFAGLIALFSYIYRDAKRRNMNAVMWTLLAIFAPSGIGIILYFLLREPLAIFCSRCGTAASAGFGYCPSCGSPLAVGMSAMPPGTAARVDPLRSCGTRL